MIISFNGMAGSGKSTVAKRLSEELGWLRYDIGGLRRQKAKERNLTLSEYNLLGENDPTTDTEVDKYQEQLAKKMDNFIIEGRTSWYFIPHSLKIFFDVDEKIGAERIHQDLVHNKNRNEDTDLKTVEQVLASNRKRRRSDNLRYRKYYDIDVLDKSKYDLVIDTSQLGKEEVYAKVRDFIFKILNTPQS